MFADHPGHKQKRLLLLTETTTTTTRVANLSSDVTMLLLLLVLLWWFVSRLAAADAFMRLAIKHDYMGEYTTILSFCGNSCFTSVSTNFESRL